MKANFDTTYCLNQECEKKCWRYFGNYEFEKDKNYWYIEKCAEKRK